MATVPPAFLAGFGSQIMRSRPQVSTTSCEVEIIAPSGHKEVFRTDEPSEDLLAVETMNDIGQATGSFILHFAPRQQDGQFWDDRIPVRSLVTIRMWRPEELTSVYGPPDMKATTVMVGLTDTHQHTGDYQNAQIRQSVTIHGRSMSTILLDAVLYYHPFLSLNPELNTLSVLTRLLGGEQQVAIVFDENLIKGNQPPQEIIARILRFFLFGGGGGGLGSSHAGVQKPIITLMLPNRRLADVLDINSGAWNTFQPVVQAIANTPQQVGSLWNYLHNFVDHSFQEFFTRIEAGVCKIHFRGKPFLQAEVMTGTRFKTDDPTLQTSTLDQDDILSEQLSRSTVNIYNVFWVQPIGHTQWFTSSGLKFLFPPAVITAPTHPSSMAKFGIRIMEVATPYLTSLIQESGTPSQPPASPAAVVTPKRNDLPMEEGFTANQKKYVPMALSSVTKAWQGVDKITGKPIQLLPDSLKSWFVANIQAESNFIPDAVSRAGAEGIMQITPSTGATLGLKPGEALDPEKAIPAGARYFVQLSQQLKTQDPQLLVAAYNAGPNAVIAAGNRIPNIPETQQHVLRVAQFQKRYADLTMTAAPTVPTTDPPSTPQPDAPTGSGLPLDPSALIATAKRWSNILRAWYGVGSELAAGTITVRGSHRWNVGNRLVTQEIHGEREFYVEGVQHRYNFATGEYLTVLRVTRGWYTNATVEDPGAAHPAIQSVSGGLADTDKTLFAL